MGFLKRNWILIVGAVVGLLLAHLIIQGEKAKVRQEMTESQAAAARIWEVASVGRYTFRGTKKYETGMFQTFDTVRLWIKPADRKRFRGKEAVLVAANASTTARCSQIDRYLKIEPGDQLYFQYDKEHSDHLSGWGPYENLRLWMIVPKDKLKDFPGDFRQHPEYRFNWGR